MNIFIDTHKDELATFVGEEEKREREEGEEGGEGEGEKKVRVERW